MVCLKLTELSVSSRELHGDWIEMARATGSRPENGSDQHGRSRGERLVVTTAEQISRKADNPSAVGQPGGRVAATAAVPSGSYWPSFVFAVAVLILLALSVVRTYSLGQHQIMYDNPVYRWRESLAIALSRMQDPPLHGYLAYRSIRNYLAEHGLALVAGEAKAVSTPEERRALTHNEARMNQLIQAASRVTIDPSLEPVTLRGNELGLADFFYWAFRIFGLEVSSLVFFYYSILLVSVALFFLTFRHSPFCLLLLMLYLVGHYFAVHLATFGQLQTIHNSRFFPVLALLPAMHLLLLLLRRERPSLQNVAAAALQTFILFFIVFCRGQTIWQVLAILASSVLVVRFREAWRALPELRLWPTTLKTIAADTWPALIVACGLAGFLAYSWLAPDPRFYGSESKTHAFWHAVYVGMISTDRELRSRYGYGEKPYTDTMGYLAALHELRGRNEAPNGLAEVADGVININIIKDTGAYDRIMRGIVFHVIAEHPWLTLRSFLIGKPSDQFEILTHIAPLWNVRPYLESLILAAGASLLALFAGAGVPQRRQLRRSAIVFLPLAICSSMTTVVVATATIQDVIIFYLIVMLLVAVYLPLALVWQRLRSRAARCPR